MDRLKYKPKEYQILVSKLIDDNHKICRIHGLPHTFFKAVDGVEVLSNFDSVFNSFVKDFPHTHHMSHDQLVFTFKILLQQQLDNYWYSGFKTYNTNLEIYNDRSLVCFNNEDVKFKYLKLKPGKNSVSKISHLLLKLINSPLKNSNGMFLPYAPKGMFNFLNKLCSDLEIPLVVTNVLRSQEYQSMLLKEGHITPNESSHLYGYTVDIEQKWYKDNRPDIHKKVEEHLQSLEEEGRVNYIDYGHIWHICLSPNYIYNY